MRDGLPFSKKTVYIDDQSSMKENNFKVPEKSVKLKRLAEFLYSKGETVVTLLIVLLF